MPGKLVSKQHILAEIRRTASENGGKPLGSRRFSATTGIREHDWLGRHWARWGDATTEAGFKPNALQAAYKDELVHETLVALVRELGHFPTDAELRLKRRSDARVPSHNSFRRWGGKRETVGMLAAYCRERKGLEDVVALCAQALQEQPEDSKASDPSPEVEFGYVYLIRFGRHFKIGCTNAVGRRERELAIQLPEKSRTVHSIRTDDPAGIEQYWHRRFAARRGNGEWFNLGAEDVAAFRRRKFM